jgi:hypothetical protein
VKELRALTPQELARAEALLRNPPPGSRAAAAKGFGVDLTLLIEQLRLTPMQRLKRLEEASTVIEKWRAARRKA